MTKSKFDTAYNKWLQQVDVGEDDAVWNEIQDELDFIETWDNISARLDEFKPQRGRVIPMFYLKMIAAAAAILLLLFFPVRYLVERADHPAVVSELSGVTEETEGITSDELTLLEAAKTEEVEVVHGIAPLAPPASIIVDKSLPSYSSNDELALSKMQSLPPDASVLLTSSDATLSNLKETDFNISPEHDQYPGFSVRVVEVGLVYGYKNTWLLNHETRNGLNPGKLGNTLPTFHQDIGGSSSLMVNNRHLIGLEFLWKSEAGQKYQQYINASYVERNILLDYLKLQAFYIWEHDGFPGQAIFGGYVGRLTAAEELVDKTRLNVGDSYSNLDFGLLAGYQLNFALKNRFMVKPGLRVSYNLVNIFEGNDITPSYYKRTNNLSASFNISLSYGLYK
jgi:hypothetical protein